MRKIEDQAESQAEQAAYDQWVAEARAHGLNGEGDIFRAGWVAARDWQRKQAEREVSATQTREAETAEWYEDAAKQARR